MDLDALLHHYFRDADDEAGLERAKDRLALDFGLENEAGRRFALWSLMHGVGIAPDPANAFKTQRERDAAYNYIRLAARLEES